jgi:hypothetical protein
LRQSFLNPVSYLINKFEDSSHFKNVAEALVALATTAKTFIDKVSIQGCSDVDDFLKEIKKESQLAIPQNTLYKSDTTTEIDVEVNPSLIVGGNSRGNPRIVKTTAIGKTSCLVTTRKISVEASCRKYLDALAFKLSTYYVFKEKSKLGATFGDVLEAIKIGKSNYSISLKLFLK